MTTPKGGSTQTSTQVQQVPAYASAAQQNLLDEGNNVLSPWLSQQAYTSAPINSDQTGAYDLTRLLATNAFSQPVPTLDPAQSSYQANTYQPSQVSSSGYTPTSYTPTSYNPTMASAAQVDGASIHALLNPYTQDVVDTTNATIQRNANQQQAALGAKMAAAGAFGGSRQAIQSGQLARATGDQIASTTAQLMAAGYDKATATALANAQMRQQVELANQAAQNTAGQFNAGAQNTAGQFNAGAANTASQFNQGAQNSASSQNAQANNASYAANAAAQNQAAQFGVTQGASSVLQRANLQESLNSGNFNRQLEALQALLGIGNAQQTTVQNNLNTPLSYLQLLSQITPTNYGGTTTSTQPNTAPSPLQTLLGAGTTLGAAYLM